MERGCKMFRATLENITMTATANNNYPSGFLDFQRRQENNHQTRVHEPDNGPEDTRLSRIVELEDADGGEYETPRG